MARPATARTSASPTAASTTRSRAGSGAAARGAASRTSCSTIGWSWTFTVLIPGDRPPPEDIATRVRRGGRTARSAHEERAGHRTPGHQGPDDVQIGKGRPMGSAAAQHGCDRSYVKEDDADQDEHPAAPPGPRRGRGTRSHRARLGERGFRRAPGWNPQGRHRRRQPGHDGLRRERRHGEDLRPLARPGQLQGRSRRRLRGRLAELGPDRRREDRGRQRLAAGRRRR